MKNAEKCAISHYDRRRYSRERASERVMCRGQAIYCKGPVMGHRTEQRHVGGMVISLQVAHRNNVHQLQLAQIGATPVERSHISRHIALSEARSRLDQRRSLQVNSHFSEFFKIYKICTILRRPNLKILQNLVKNFVILKKISHNF